MTNGGKPVLRVVGIVLLGVWTSALANQTSGGNPYQAIVDRNVFGLKPPAPLPDPEANKPPPRKLTLTGVYKMGGTARALIKVAEPPKPPDPAKEIPLILSEGQRDADVEVLSIDTVAGVVKVNNAGTVMSIDFTNNGTSTKVAGGGGPAGMPKTGGPGVPPAPNPFVLPVPSPGAPPSTARPMRPTGMPGGPVSPAGYSAAQPVTTYSALPTSSTYNTSPGIAVGTTPSGTLAVPGMASAPATTTAPQNWPPEPKTAEEAAILAHMYSQQHAKEIEAGTMPSIPGGDPLAENQTPSGHTTTPATTPAGPQLPPGAARRYVPQ